MMDEKKLLGQRKAHTLLPRLLISATSGQGSDILCFTWAKFIPQIQVPRSPSLGAQPQAVVTAELEAGRQSAILHGS